MHTWNILCQITLYNLPPILHPPPSALSHFHKITNSLAGFGGRWYPFSSPLRIVSQFVCASLGQVRSASGPLPPPPPLSSPHSHNPTQRCRLSQFRHRSREKLGKSRQQQHSLGPPPPPTNQPTTTSPSALYNVRSTAVCSRDKSPQNGILRTIQLYYYYYMKRHSAI